MPRETRLSIAKPDIVQVFEQRAGRVFTRGDIEQILAENRAFWRLTQSMSTAKFTSFLVENTKMQEVRLDFAYRPTVRYVWGEIRLFELVQSVKAESYFSHYTAMRLHGLTEQIPKTIYLNFEQHLAGGGQLSQAAINRAFKAGCRVSSNIATYDDQRICLINGRNTGQLGVVDFEPDDGSRLRVTNVERTLIDITVRPIYSGGVFEVSRAFAMARDRVSVNKLAAYLKKLKYAYPYHQAIGFYLEHAGEYRESQISLLRELGTQFDFYLTHGMKETDYIEKWRLFVPKRF